MIDNVSFTNTFSEEVTEENKWAFLKTFTPGTALGIRDQSFGFGWDGDPKKNRLHGSVGVKETLYTPSLSRTYWNDGATGITFNDGVASGKFTFVENISAYTFRITARHC